MTGRTPRTIPSQQQTRARDLRSNATPAERYLWSKLRASQLDGIKFSRQIAIGPFIADIVCRTRKLVIELDGGHHGDARDQARQRFIEAQGYRVLRFWNAQVLQDIDSVVRVILAALQERDGLGVGTSHPRPLPQAGGEQEEGGEPQ